MLKCVCYSWPQIRWRLTCESRSKTGNKHDVHGGNISRCWRSSHHDHSHHCWCCSHLCLLSQTSTVIWHIWMIAEVQNWLYYVSRVQPKDVFLYSYKALYTVRLLTYVEMWKRKHLMGIHNIDSMLKINTCKRQSHSNHWQMNGWVACRPSGQYNLL